MAPKARFAAGEKVLCFHGPLLYEAKCLSSEMKDKHMKYFIHYSGWNKNWDEWVPECRVLKYNDSNLQKQRDLEKTHMKSKKSKNSKTAAKKDTEKEKETTPTPTPPVVSERPKQQKPEKRVAVSPPVEPSPPPVEPKEIKIKTERSFDDEPKMEVEIKLVIPSNLQHWLVDDFDLINHQKKILHLPARITVDHIIASYVKEKVSVKGLSSNLESKIVQFANRIRDCFNVLLGKYLLYKFERPQYGEVLLEHSDLQMCEIYGAIHLLRMFTTFAKTLSPTSDDGNFMSPLVDHIEDFVKYMSANSSFLSLDDYVVASPEYHRRALT